MADFCLIYLKSLSTLLPAFLPSCPSALFWYLCAKMKLAATIRILFVLILALGFMDQHNGSTMSSSLSKQKAASDTANAGNFSSHPFIDVQHADDILSETFEMTGTPEFVLAGLISFPVPAAILADSSPCWQPPEFVS